MAPLIGEVGGCETSGWFAYLNTNKRSVELDVAHDRNTLNDLIASAHAVVDDHTSAAKVAAQQPDLVVCSITPFGNDAPVDMRNAKSLNVFHASGWGYHTPSHADPARPPLKGPAASSPTTKPASTRRRVASAFAIGWSRIDRPAASLTSNAMERWLRRTV